MGSNQAADLVDVERPRPTDTPAAVSTAALRRNAPALTARGRYAVRWKMWATWPSVGSRRTYGSRPSHR